MFDNDTVVQPKESEHFQVYDEYGFLVKLEDQDMYKEDWLGLRTLKEDGRLQMHTVPGVHMNLTQDLVDTYVVPLLCGDQGCLPKTQSEGFLKEQFYQ